MLPIDTSGMTLAIMLQLHAGKAKQEAVAKAREQEGGLAQTSMLAFYDAMEHTASAFCQVIDGKATTSEAHDGLFDYAERLEKHLIGLDEEFSDIEGEGE